MKPIRLIPLVTALLITGACADDQQANTTTGDHGKPYAAPIQHIISEGVEIHETFDAPGDLTGYVGLYQGRPLEIYLTGDEKHAVVGTLIDSAGEPVAQQRLAQAASSGLNWDSFDSTHWIAEGEQDAERIVYAFMDPNCPYCAMFWEKAQPYLEQGGVQLRHIMVGMLRPSSLGKAATILAADDPAAALAHHERTMQQGGIDEMQEIPEDKLAQVQENTEFMRSVGIGATPAIIFKDPDGRVQQVQGVPNDRVMREFIFATSER